MENPPKSMLKCAFGGFCPINCGKTSFVEMEHEMQYILYDSPDRDARVEVAVKDEMIWMTQKAMAQLFGVQVPTISKHLKNIFAEGE